MPSLWDGKYTPLGKPLQSLRVTPLRSEPQNGEQASVARAVTVPPRWGSKAPAWAAAPLIQGRPGDAGAGRGAMASRAAVISGSERARSKLWRVWS